MTTTTPAIQRAPDGGAAQRLAGLADRLELAELVSRLGRWIDEHRWDEASTVLADDVTVVTPGGRAEGIAAVTDQARRNHEAHTTQHVITNVLSDLDGDHAQVTANLVVRFAPPGPPAAPTFQAGERYRFGARRTPTGWRLTSVAIEPLWVLGSPPPACELSGRPGRPGANGAGEISARPPFVRGAMPSPLARLTAALRDPGGTGDEIRAVEPALEGHRYLLLTTFRRDGTPVATPVWFAPDGWRLVVTSEASAWKVKRLAHDPRATAQPCDVRGRPLGPPVPMQGRVLGPAEAHQADRALRHRYGAAYDAIGLVGRARRLGRTPDRAFLALVPVTDAKGPDS